MTTMTAERANRFFTYCMRGFTNQKPEIILEDAPVFVEINNNLCIDYNHFAFKKLPKVFSSNFNILTIIAEQFLTLCRCDCPPEDASHAAVALMQGADEKIRANLDPILPSLNAGVISAIAREKYESRDNEGYFAGFITEDTSDIEKHISEIVYFSDIDGDVLGYDSVHGHRKLLNLSSGKDPMHCLIYKRDTERTDGYRVLGATYLSNVANSIPIIRFISHGEWELYLPSELNNPDNKNVHEIRCCAAFRDGHYCLPELDVSTGEKNLLTKKLKKHLKDLSSLSGVDPVETAYTILQRAKLQSKGALVVLASEQLMDNLCDRFCRNHNAIDMRKNSTLVDLLANPEALDRFSSIDGAVMVDFSGKVRAIGCIIDSIAAMGTITRGSRYNGTVGFLYQEGHRKGRPFLLALVVSEDGIVDIIASDEVKSA